MKIIVRPILDPQREIDLTHRLVAAIAEELWRLFGGNDQLNWIEAEWHLQRIIGQTRVRARERETAVSRVASEAPDRSINRRGQSVRRERTDGGSPRSSRTGARGRPQTRRIAGEANWKTNTPQMADTATANPG